jgi:hypothetical protein
MIIAKSVDYRSIKRIVVHFFIKRGVIMGGAGLSDNPVSRNWDLISQ